MNLSDYKVSLYRYHITKDERLVYIKAVTKVSLAKIAELASSADFIEKQRELDNASPDDYKWLKARLPSFTAAGWFSDRRVGYPTVPTGLVHIETDADDGRSLIDCKLRGVLMQGPSRRYKKLVQLDPVPCTREAYIWAAQKLREEYDLELDNSCLEPSRICYLPGLPMQFVDGSAYAWSQDEYAEELARREKQAAETAKKHARYKNSNKITGVKALLDHIITNDYKTGLRVAAALKDEPGGRQLFIEWSAEQYGYNCQEDYDEGNRIFDSAQKLAQVGFGTLVHLARDGGWAPPTREELFRRLMNQGGK